MHPFFHDLQKQYDAGLLLLFFIDLRTSYTGEKKELKYQCSRRDTQNMRVCFLGLGVGGFAFALRSKISTHSIES